MKVKVIKQNKNSTFWWNKCVGETFEVLYPEEYKDLATFCVLKPDVGPCVIFKSNCEIINE